MKDRRFTVIGALAISCLAANVLPAYGTAPGYEPYQAYALGSTAESVVVADINGDNRLDIVVSTSSGDA